MDRRSASLELGDELCMTELSEHGFKVEPESFGWVLAARPSGGVEQFARVGLQLKEILQMPAAIAIHGCVQLQENLIPPTDMVDLQAWPVAPWSQPLL